MKILNYFQGERIINKSGIGRARRHQRKAYDLVKQDYTIDKRDKFDMAHINTVYGKSYRLLKKCHKKNIPVIVHGHSTYEDYCNSFACWKLFRGWFYHRLRVIYSNADAIITPTEYSKKLIDSYGFNVPIYACSNGIDLDEFSYSQEKVDKFKKLFNIKEGQKLIIGVGMLFQRKGIHDFIEIARHFPDITFIWFGNLFPLFRTRFIKKALRKKPDNVILPGYMDNDILKGAYLCADVFLFPSYEETEGIVVLEALASRCVTLVRDIGVYKEWLSDGINCYKAHNNEEFIEKIKYILENPQEEIKENGYEVIKERSLQKVGQKLKDIYEEVYKNYKEKNKV